LICARSRTSAFGIAFDRLSGSQFDGLDLIADQVAPLQQAVQFGQRVGWQ
jgi:hypothetical protein